MTYHVRQKDTEKGGTGIRQGVQKMRKVDSWDI